jgi:hypothetical protein
MSIEHRHVCCVLQPFIVVAERMHYCYGHYDNHHNGNVMCYHFFCCSRTLGVVMDYRARHYGGHLVLLANCR